MKTSNLIFFLLICCFFFCTQCKKEKIKGCIDHVQLTDGRDNSLHEVVYPAFGMPSFNPNNPDEFIFRDYTNQTPDSFNMVKYNLITKEYTLIFRGYFTSRPRWSKKDWIIFGIWSGQIGTGFDIWKMKSNGDSLTQLTFNGRSHNPEWNLEGDKFIYEIGYTSPAQYVIADENGLPLDTVLGLTSTGNWQHDSLMVMVDTYGFLVANPYNNTEEQLYEVERPNHQSGGGAAWLDKERVFWCHTDGIYITNVVTKQTQRIRETCNAHCYQHPTYSPEIDKVILIKLQRVNHIGGDKKFYLTLVMMNPDGSGEEDLEIVY